jgi:tRNA threonylcarbamoyladenosine biosynthesis protein TsaB
LKILAIDTTAKTATAALTEDEKLIGLTILNTPNTHSVTLLPTIEGLLNGASVTAGDIDLFVCSAGPGSFTGVRIGTSTVKGLAYAQNKTCI